MLKLIILFVCSFKILCFVCGQDLFEGSQCTANGKEGRCVHYKRCLSLIQDRKDGKQPEICSYIGKSPVICCTDCELVEDIDKIVIDPHLGFRYKDGSKAWDYCLDSYQKLPYFCKRHFSYSLRREWNETKQCHEISLAAVGAVGGENARRGEFPHMALLGYGDDEEGLQWLCGGSLISDRYILTAAHCSSALSLGPVTYAALGILKRSDPEELWQKYKIQSIISYPGYSSPSKYHDIALLKTETRVQFSVDVLPACVNSRETPWSEQEWAYGMGWGALGHRKENADTLQKVKILKYTPEECSKLYPTHRHLLQGYNHTTQMCYGDRTDVKDTCAGDSGGPLAVKTGCMYDVIGVTSYGRACGFANQAGIYTRVRHYVSWIESVVWP